MASPGIVQFAKPAIDPHHDSISHALDSIQVQIDKVTKIASAKVRQMFENTIRNSKDSIMQAAIGLAAQIKKGSSASETASQEVEVDKGSDGDDEAEDAEADGDEAGVKQSEHKPSAITDEEAGAEQKEPEQEQEPVSLEPEAQRLDCTAE